MTSRRKECVEMADYDVIDEALVRDFAKRLSDAGCSGDVDAILALCRDDVVKVAPIPPGRFEGKTAVRGEVEMYFRAFSETQIEPVGEPYLSLDDTSAAANWRWRARMAGSLEPPGFAPTGQWVEFESVEIYRFREGLLAHWTVVFDMLDVGRQIGAAPAPGTGAERFGVFLQKRAARKMRRRAASS